LGGQGRIRKHNSMTPSQTFKNRGRKGTTVPSVKTLSMITKEKKGDKSSFKLRQCGFSQKIHTKKRGASGEGSTLVLFGRRTRIKVRVQRGVKPNGHKGKKKKKKKKKKLLPNIRGNGNPLISLLG